MVEHARATYPNECVGAMLGRIDGDSKEVLAAMRLENSGWKDSVGTAITSDPSVTRFYTLLTDRAGDCRWMRLLFFSIGGKRIAASLAAVYENRLFLLKTGYDPEFAKCSPFKVLTYFALREAISAGLTEFDFLGDAEPWKLEWTTTTRPHDWLFIFSGTMRARRPCSST